MRKFVSQPITPEFRAQVKANLARLPARFRFLGRTEPQCDFCAGLNPEHVYAASRMTDGTPQQCWRWLACPKCHALIQANNFDALYSTSAVNNFGGTKKAEDIVRITMMAFHVDALLE